MFFGSGCASLILQVVWFKQLQFVLGSSTYAVSITVASFFLGLSLGGALGGRLADQVERPLRAYGALELALGAASLVITLLLSKWAVWVGVIAPLLAADSALRLPLMTAVSFAVLLLPTIGMGATLPFLARFLVRHQESLAARIGVLYGINTLGAAAGSFLVGFVLIGLLGVFASSAVAATIYGLIGLTALGLSRTEAATVSAPTETKATSAAATGRQALVYVFALSGFVSIGYEIVWFRMLSTVSNQRVYAFAGMLSVYLLGLVVGSFICARWLSHRKQHLARYFALAQLGIAVSAMLTIAMLGRSRNLTDVLGAIPIPAAAAKWLGGSPEFMLVCLVVLFVPTTLIGLTFPLASELTITRLGQLGRRLGALYAVNTLGGVAGSLTAGFLLLPLFGVHWSMVALITLNLVLFATVVGTQPELCNDRELLRQGGLGLAIVVLGLLAIGPGFLTSELRGYDDAKVVELRETKEATFAVLEYESEVSGRFVQLVVNGKSYASNKPPGRRYMASLAHYPTLLHPDPHEALVICIGTGTTVGSLTTHDRLTSIRAVDLVPYVFEFAHWFEPINQSFHTNPAVEQVVADGRHYLLSSGAEFDVLTFEPPPPADAGVVNLYSEEFYQLAKARMHEGAIVAQWAPMDMDPGELPRMLLRAMFEEFPHVSLWMPNRMEGVAIASMQPLQINPAQLAERMAEPRVAADLAAIGITSPEHFLATFVAADDELRAWVGDADSVSDDRPSLEYHNFYTADRLAVSEIIAMRQPIEPQLAAPVANPERLTQSLAVVDGIWLSHEAFFAGDYATSRTHLQVSRAIEPDNAYLQFLDRRLSAAEE